TLLVASWVRRGRPGLPGVRDADRAGWAVVLSLGLAAPIVGLAVLFLFSDVFLIRDPQAPAASTTRLTVKVIAHQYWWEVRYPGPPRARGARASSRPRAATAATGSAAPRRMGTWAPT